MAEPLPPPMVAPLAALGQALAQWSAAQRDASLATHEQGVLDAVRAALPALLAAVLQVSTTAIAPEQQRLRQPCPRCGARTRPRRQWRQRTLKTVCGPVTYERPCYW